MVLVQHEMQIQILLVLELSWNTEETIEGESHLKRERARSIK